MTATSDQLPPQARALMEVIGIRGVLALADKYGGRWLYVPKQVTSDHPLSELLGKKNASRLCDLHGGENIKPPACRAYLRELRDQEIYRRHYDDGFSLDRLAGEYGLTQSGIVRAIQRSRAREESPSTNYQVSLL